jgi:hypothetical protein
VGARKGKKGGRPVRFSTFSRRFSKQFVSILFTLKTGSVAAQEAARKKMGLK